MPGPQCQVVYMLCPETDVIFHSPPMKRSNGARAPARSDCEVIGGREVSGVDDLSAVHVARRANTVPPKLACSRECMKCEQLGSTNMMTGDGSAGVDFLMVTQFRRSGSRHHHTAVTGEPAIDRFGEQDPAPRSGRNAGETIAVRRYFHRSARRASCMRESSSMAVAGTRWESPCWRRCKFHRAIGRGMDSDASSVC